MILNCWLHWSGFHHKAYLWYTIVVEPWDGEGDNECDFSKNAGEADEVENSESGEIGLDGSLRNDRSLNSFSPDNLLPVMFSKSNLRTKGKSMFLYSITIEKGCWIM